MTNSEFEWHCTFFERQSHHIFSYDQQLVRDITHFLKGSLIHIFSYDQQGVSDIEDLWKAVSSHLFLWPTVCEWHCTFCNRQSHHIFSYDQQLVSDIAHFATGSLIPMTNSLWVTLHILWKAVSSDLFLGPTGSGWHCTFCENQSHHIFSYDQQGVSDIEHLWKAVSLHLLLWPQHVSDIAQYMKGSLITSFSMTNRKWVTLHILWKAVPSQLYDQQLVSDIAHLWKTNSSHLSHYKQVVGDITHFVKGSLITMTNRKWGHCTFCERQSHHTSSYDQQHVSDIAHFVNGTLIRSFLCPTVCRWHYTFLWNAISLHLFLSAAGEWCWKCSLITFFLWPTGSEWHCIFVNSSLITSFPMANSLWVTLHTCEQQSHHIFPYDQQLVSDIWPAFSAHPNWQMIDILLHQKVSMLPCLFHVFLLHCYYHRL